MYQVRFVCDLIQSLPIVSQPPVDFFQIGIDSLERLLDGILKLGQSDGGGFRS